ncbi:unnamed protein product [Musa acuminata var. zebrina]
MSRVRVADALSSRRKHHEHHAGHEPSPQRQVHQQLPHLRPYLGEEALDDVGVAEGHGQEHHHPQHRVDAVPHPQPVPPQVPQHPAPLLLLPLVVDHVQPPQGGDPVVELAVAAPEAVGKGEERACGSAQVDQRRGEVPVRAPARAAVGEGRRQGLEGQHGAARQQLHQARHARYRLVDHRRGRRRLLLLLFHVLTEFMLSDDCGEGRRALI